MKRTPLFGWCVLLAACSDGGGGPPPIAPPPPPPEMIGGIWVGTGTDDVTGQSSNIVGIVTEDRRARFVTSDGVQTVSINPLTVSGNDVSGQLRAYAPLGFTFSNGATVAEGTLSATVRERDSFVGSWEVSATGESGDVDLLFDNLYERNSSFSLIDDTWAGVDQFGNNTSLFDITATGVVSGSDIDGCLYSGQVNLIDTDYNAYELQIRVSSCAALNGTYDGLGVLDDTNRQNDTLVFQLNNNLRILTAVVLRQ